MTKRHPTLSDQQADLISRLQSAGYDAKWQVDRAGNAATIDFGDSHKIRREGRDGKTTVIPGQTIRMTFDHPDICEGPAITIRTKKPWHRTALEDFHRDAFEIAVNFRNEAAAQEAAPRVSGADA